MVNLGNVEVRVRDYDAALNAYSRASRLAPGIAGYRLKEALVLFEVSSKAWDLSSVYA